MRAELAQPMPAIALLLFVIVGVYHMQIGMRSVILDYLRGHAREWALIANALFRGRARRGVRLRGAAHQLRLKAYN